MDIRNLQVAVVGLGASGIAAARLALSKGAQLSVFDEADKLSAAARALCDEGAQLYLGPLAPHAFEHAKLVVVSPGVPQREAIDRAEADGCEVISEVDFAARYISAPLVLIGGTNGKSTVTAMCHAMLEASGVSAFIGGNFGTPVSEAVGQDHAVVIIEISSFQAERVPTLRPKVHALLNVTEDHLDRYDSFERYAAAKGNPFANMTDEDVAVVPEGDAAIAAQVSRGRARTVTFSTTGPADVMVRGQAIVAGGLSMPLAELGVRGRHNVANACAALAVAREVGATDDGIRTALAAFKGLPHRHTLVRELGGVRFYDDSKATNVGAAVAALAGLDEERAVLIAGGRDKLGDYAPLVRALESRGRALVVIGEAADRIAAAAGGQVPTHRASTLEDAVRVAASLAEDGDAVLLSPACSSYDMFKSYKARGEAFQKAVLELGEAS